MTQAVEINQDRRPTIEIAELFPIQGEWTEADYFHLPETNRIIELSEGRLIITPSPTSQHQIILGNLFAIIRNHVFSKKLGKIVTAPMDVKLWNGKIRQPDIVFTSNEHEDRITEESWGVPDLVIEVLSEHTEKEDRTKKFSEYAKAGISEYWIVDPFKKAIEVYYLKDSAYEPFGKWYAGEIAKSKLLDGCKVSVDDIMI